MSTTPTEAKPKKIGRTVLAKYFHDNGYEPIPPHVFYREMFPQGELAPFHEDGSYDPNVWRYNGIILHRTNKTREVISHNDFLKDDLIMHRNIFKKRIYEDMVNGKLSEVRFQVLADDYEKEQDELSEKIEMLEEEIQNQEDQTENVDKFIRQAKKYLHLEKLTPAVLNDLVKAVYVHAPDNSSGHRVQDVEISYNYIGILPATLLYDLQNGKTA